METNYELVLEIIESYEDESVLNDFKSKFKEGENISKKEYFEFCKEYIDDMSDMYYIKLNWKYIESGGDEGVWES